MSFDEIHRMSYIDVMKANAMLDMQETIDAAMLAFDGQEGKNKVGAEGKGGG